MQATVKSNVCEWQETIDTETAAYLLQKAHRTVKWQVQNGFLHADIVKGVTGGKSGMSYRIPVTALPAEAQLKWRQMQINRNGGYKVDVDLVGYAMRYGEDGLKKLFALEAAIQEAQLLNDRAPGKTREMRQAIADRLGISLARLYQLQKSYGEEGLGGIMRTTKRSDVGKPRTMCLMAQDYIFNAYCVPGQVSQNKVFDNLRDTARRLKEQEICACEICPHNPNSLCRQQMSGNKDEALAEYDPCESYGDGILLPTSRCAVNRYIKTIPEGTKDAGRRGWKYWEAKHMPKAKRDKPELINEVWFGDHHQFDIFVNVDGKPMRPWLTACTDAKSNAFVGWALSLNPNSDTILEALIKGIAETKGSPFSGAPQAFYIDNGKDYRSKRIEGDSLKDYELGRINANLTDDNAFLKTLGIGVTHAIPYRAWSKTIERIFGIIEPRWIRELPGWCGNGIATRPEELNKQIKRGELMTFEEFATYWATVVLPEYHDYKAEGAKESPLEIYMAGTKARTEKYSWSVLAMGKSLRAERVVTASGIRVRNEYYQDVALHELVGKRVTVLYMQDDTSSVTVMQGNQFVCEAFAVERLKLVGEDSERLGEHMREQQTMKKKTKLQLKLPADRLQMLNHVVSEIPDYASAGNVTSMVHERAYRERMAAKEAQAERQEQTKGAGDILRRKWAARGAAALKELNEG